MTRGFMKELLKMIINLPCYIYNKCVFLFHKSNVAKSVVINGKLRVYGKGKIILEDGVRINSRFRNNPIGGQVFSSFYSKKDAVIKIGKETGISNTSIYAAKQVIIGAHTKIGGNVKIYDTDFHSLDYKERADMERDVSTVCGVEIGDNVFLGAHSIVLKGVKIGDRSIVGAGSVVTKSIPCDEVWGGNPARFIRKINSLECDKK